MSRFLASALFVSIAALLPSCQCDRAPILVSPQLRELPDEVAQPEAMYERARRAAKAQITADNVDERLNEIEREIREELESLR